MMPYKKHIYRTTSNNPLPLGSVCFPDWRNFKKILEEGVVDHYQTDLSQPEEFFPEVRNSLLWQESL